MYHQSFIVEQGEQQALNRFFGKIYALVAAGIGLSAAMSFATMTVFQPFLFSLLRGGSPVLMVLMLAQLALVFAASGLAHKNSPRALPVFLLYSLMNGVTLSVVLLVYTGETVLLAFLSAAAMFAVMAVIGMTTKKNLSGLGQALHAALWGVLIAGLLNFFFRSSGMSFLLSLVSVVIFAGLIAYDNQRIRAVFEQTGGQVGSGWVVSMALQLYLDFINLFLHLLRIFGRMNRD